MGIRKDIPPPTLDVVSPPNKEYVYFEGAQEHPFRSTSTHYDVVNASWLADASLLAYADLTFARAQYLRAGMDHVEPFTGRSTQCFVAHNETSVIVSFRGTRVLKAGEKISVQDIVHDLMTDARFTLVRFQDGGCVHEGFQAALDQIWDLTEGLRPYLDAIGNNRDRSLWFTGHSLGAALATLAAQRHGHAQGLYTFGSPLVGDRQFARTFAIPAYRFVHNNDFVTRIPSEGIYKPVQVPPTGAYEHVGELKYLDSQGAILDDPGRPQRIEERLRGYLSRTTNIVQEVFRSGVVGIAADDFVDHAPIYYATHIWNNAVAQA